jgi:uncharacterized protein (TIGR00251 family)
MNLPVRVGPGGVQFAVKAVPGASRDRIVGVLGDALKVQVAAPAEGGKANARLCELLAHSLGLPASAVQVQTGHGSPRKVVAVQGLDAEALLLALAQASSRGPA